MAQILSSGVLRTLRVSVPVRLWSMILGPLS